MRLLASFVLCMIIASYALAGLPPTSSRITGESVDATTFTFRFPNFTGTRTGTVISLGVNSVAGGGTGSSTALNNNRIMQSSGGNIVEASAITASRALASDANGIPVASSTTATELGYVSGVSSAIQTQFTGKASTTLNNLGTTSINAALIPSAADTHNIGSSTVGFNFLYTKYVRAGGNSYGVNISGGAENQGMPSGTSVSGLLSVQSTGRLGLNTAESATATASGDIQIETGNNSSSGNSGDIKLTTGTVGAGTRGSVVITAKQLQVPDGTASLPGMTFSADPNTGVYRSGADALELAAGGYSGLQVGKSTGSYANVGMGGNASTSDAYLLLAQRSYATPIHFQLSNPNTGAGSGGKIQLVADNGNNYGEIGLFAVATAAPDAYAGGQMTIRSSGTTTGISYIADDVAAAVHKFYAGGNGASNKKMSISSEGVFVQGAYNGAVTAASANDTLDGTDQYVTVDASGAARTITLPDCVAGILGRTYHIKKIDSSANAVNIARTGSDDTFDGSTSYAFNTQYQSITLVCVSTTLWGIF